MNTQTGLDRGAAAWLADGPTELSDRVLDAALREVHLTPQRHALRVPWRFPPMPAFTRLTGIAAVALVAVVGAGSVIYLVSNRPGGSGSQSTSAPTVAPTPEPSYVASGITGWTTYTSAVHGFTVGYPADWSVNAPATREWQAGDSVAKNDVWPYADTFISPEQDAVGLFVWEMPAGEGADVESVQGLKAWAEAFCQDVGASACEEFAQRAVPMCLNAGGDSCRAAILVPTAGEQYAFFVDWTSAMFTGSPDLVRVVVVAREDSFPSAVRYGGSVELLRSILTTMDVRTR
jgi:hypothetical protein